MDATYTEAMERLAKWVELWNRILGWRLERAESERRLEEALADLESHSTYLADRAVRRPLPMLWARVVRGIPADLAWSCEARVDLGAAAKGVLVTLPIGLVSLLLLPVLCTAVALAIGVELSLAQLSMALRFGCNFVLYAAAGFAMGIRLPRYAGVTSVLFVLGIQLLGFLWSCGEGATLSANRLPLLPMLINGTFATWAGHRLGSLLRVRRAEP